MTTYFSAYDLTIKSDIDLLLPTIQATSAPDITVNFGTVPNVSKNRSWDGVWYEYKSKELLYLRWDMLGSYQIQSGKEILIHPNEPVNHDNIRQPILGTIMAMALQQRGCMTLHGSAVLLDKQVTIFMGNKGEGKSTLAAWLISQGFPLLSDDVCAMDYGDKHPLSIRPAFPKIRLNPDALLHFGDTPDNYPQVHPQVPKRIQDLNQGFCPTTKPVGAICVLETGDTLTLEQLHGIEAIKEILTHMMINRFPENQPIDLQKEIFTQATHLTKSIPVYRLTRPRDLDLLTETTGLLQEMATKH